jgi:hypothetical protein
MQQFITFNVGWYPTASRESEKRSITIDIKIPDGLTLHEDYEFNEILLKRKHTEYKEVLYNTLCEVHITEMADVYAYEPCNSFYPVVKKWSILEFPKENIVKCNFAIEAEGTYYDNRNNFTRMSYATVFKFLIGLTKAGYTYQVIDVGDKGSHPFVNIIASKLNKIVDLLQ